MIASLSALGLRSNRTPVASKQTCRPCQAFVDPRASVDRVVPHALDLGDPDRAVAQAVVAGVPTPVEPPASTNPLSNITKSPIVLWYLRVLDEKPLVTKQWTSLSGFVIGDILAQLLTEPEFLVSRTLTLAGYGFFIDAVAGHHFYEWLDKNIEPGRAKTAKAGERSPRFSELSIPELSISNLQVSAPLPCSVSRVVVQKEVTRHVGI
jgi:hypothetical protein